MKLFKLINKIILGEKITLANIDKSMSRSELEKRGIPYLTICMKVNKNTMVCIDPSNLNSYFSKEFVLDSLKKPRYIETIYGKKNIFYLKQYTGKFEETDKQHGQIIFEGYKEKKRTSAAILNGYFSPAMIDIAIIQIEKKLLEIRDSIGNEREIHDFENQEIGTFQFKIDFMKSHENELLDEYFMTKTTFNSWGFTIEEINELVINYKNKLFPQN